MIEYVKVKHDEECYICHSRENVKTLRVAADGSNAANTIAFCYKCAGAVSRILNISITRRLQRAYGKPQQRGISYMRTVVLSLAATGV